MADRIIGPTPGLSDEDWRLVNGGKPEYTKHRRAADGRLVVDIVHPAPNSITVATYDPLSSPMIRMLVGNPPHTVEVRTCDLRRFHGDSCAERSERFKADRRG